MYYVDIEHPDLGKFRRIKGADEYIVHRKAEAQLQVWEEQWQRKREAAEKKEKQAIWVTQLEVRKAKALERTEVAQSNISSLANILVAGLQQPAGDLWERFYDRRTFAEPRPKAPDPQPYPREPSADDEAFKVRSHHLLWAFPNLRRKWEGEAAERFRIAHDTWAMAAKEIDSKHELALTQFNQLLAAWERRKVEFDAAQARGNVKIDSIRTRYASKDADAVTEYVDLVLSLSEYPDCFPRQSQIDYVSETGVMVVDFELPPLEALPTLKAVKYIQSRDAFDEAHLRESERSRIYDDAMYQTALRTLYEIFETDGANAISSVTFNGWVDFVDRATGQPARSCIMSVQATKEIFEKINLAQVEPKACFRTLKGVGSAKLAGMAAVVPILQLNKSDPRFVPAHDAIDGVGEATNVAAISWEEFEYLVRDIFEKEFARHGGEVKITRASRDHGVDAIAFDPDPIRGGKTVIQAKRYVNVVGVSAVRDLYGTVINEGANRGILVTTSQYGPDSYAFAKDKPITLLDGGNLLSLLESHGHKARIDLEEARKLGALRDER